MMWIDLHKRTTASLTIAHKIFKILGGKQPEGEISRRCQDVLVKQVPCCYCGGWYPLSSLENPIDMDCCWRDVLFFGANLSYALCRRCVVNELPCTDFSGIRTITRDEFLTRKGKYPQGMWITFSDWIDQLDILCRKFGYNNLRHHSEQDIEPWEYWSQGYRPDALAKIYRQRFYEMLEFRVR